VHGDMIGLAALDLILRRLGARVVCVALVIDILRMDPDDPAADAPGLRIPSDLIPDLESAAVLGISEGGSLSALFAATSRPGALWRLCTISYFGRRIHGIPRLCRKRLGLRAQL